MLARGRKIECVENIRNIQSCGFLRRCRSVSLTLSYLDGLFACVGKSEMRIDGITVSGAVFRQSMRPWKGNVLWRGDCFTLPDECRKNPPETVCSWMAPTNAAEITPDQDFLYPPWCSWLLAPLRDRKFKEGSVYPDHEDQHLSVQHIPYRGSPVWFT